MEITRYEFYYPAAHGGHDIFACIWSDTDCKYYKGVVQLAHGMSEYILRYEEFAVYLAKRGYVVCGNDMAGHGNSVDDKSDYGYFGERTDSWEYLVDDIKYLEGIVRLKYPDLKYIMLGHSMGSLLVREYMAVCGDRFNGVILLGTSGPQIKTDFGIRLSGHFMKKHPKERGVVVSQIAFGHNNRRIKNPRTVYDWFTTDKKVIEKYVKDDKCGFLFTNEGYNALFRLLKRVNRKEWAWSVPKNLPVLIMSGTDDPVGNYGNGVKCVYNRLVNAGCTNVKLKLVHGARHELLNESRHERIYYFIYNWLEKNIDDTEEYYD